MRYATILLALLIATSAATALSISAEITPTDPTTTNRLGCSLMPSGSGDLQANITWYQDNTAYTQSDETLNVTDGVQTSTSSQGEVPTNATQKAETWICQVTLSNQTNSISQNTTAETIQNSPPVVIDPTTTQVVTEGESYFLAAQATDADNESITNWLSDDLNKSDYDGEALFTIQSNGHISFTPTYEQRGNHTMALLPYDGEEYGGRNILYVVEIVNQPPTFNPEIEDQQTSQNNNWSYTITGADREGDPFNFSLLSSTLNTVELAETSSTQATLDLSTGQPRYEDRGIHNITVMVYEEGNTSHNTTDTFQLNITVDNDPPSLDPITSPSASQGDAFELNITAADPNAEDTLNFFITGNCPISNPWNITTLDDSYDGALGRISVAELSNDHVICRNVTISVQDFLDGSPKDTDEQTLTLDITNVNDAPTLYEIAQQEGTYEQTNMSELEASQDLPFRYYVRADDPDTLTYEGDDITYSTNTTNFSIDENTGVINFTPTLSDVGEHLINITVTDQQGLTDSRTMNLTIYANTPPNLQTIPDQQCPQDSNCSVQLQAQDPDAGDNLTFEIQLLEANPKSNQTNNFNWQEQGKTWNTSEWSKTYTNEMVGNYTYNITVTDRWGASDHQTWQVNATNVNDAPIIDTNQDGTPDNITLPLPFVEGFQASFNVRSTDVDFINDDNEELALSINTTGPNPNLLGTPTKTSEDTWFVTFTPSNSDVGSYNTTFMVTDAAGANDTRTYSYDVLNQSAPPVITEVKPSYDEAQQETNTQDLRNATPLNATTNVTLQEPLSYTFNFSYEDPDSNPEDIKVQWYINDELEQTSNASENYAYNEQYDFFSNGTYTYKVVLTDERYSTTNFTWEVLVEDSNRAPTLLENLTDRNITQTTVIQDMLGVFYDADDDTNSNGEIDGNETNTLLFTHESSELLDIEIDGTDVTFIPLEQGEVTLFWRATDDSGASVDSNTVTYQVTPPEDETIEPQPTAGGGGGSSPVPIPIQQDPEPESVQILIPESLTIHRNETIEAPVTVENTGERILRETQLRAETEAENVSFEWQQATIRDLQPGEAVNTTLRISNFRPVGTYDIHVHAQSTDPDVNDSAIILINSLEQARQGDEVVQTRVTFARDLFASNPECLELNEVLEQASNAASSGNSQEASRLIDAAIDGCRYLIGDNSRRLEEPSTFSIASWMGGYRYANHVLGGLLIVLLGVGGFLISQYLSAARVAREEEDS